MKKIKVFIGLSRLYYNKTTCCFLIDYGNGNTFLSDHIIKKSAVFSPVKDYFSVVSDSLEKIEGNSEVDFYVDKNTYSVWEQIKEGSVPNSPEILEVIDKIKGKNISANFVVNMVNDYDPYLSKTKGSSR